MRGSNIDYNFHWPDGTVGPSVSGLISGDYTVTITDENSTCSLEYPFTIQQQASFYTQVNTQPTTSRVPNGSANLIVKNRDDDTSPASLHFSWKDENGNEIASSRSVTGLAAGSYTVEIQDTETGCGEVIEVVIESMEPRLAIKGGKEVICQDEEEPEFFTLGAIALDCVDCTVEDWTTEDGEILRYKIDKLAVEVPVREATYTLIVKDQYGYEYSVDQTIEISRQECLSCEEQALEYIDFTGVDPCKEFTIVARRPVDPNEIHSPAGQLAPRWMAAKDVHNYTVLFENDPIFAEASASRITIDVPMDEQLDLRTFEVGDFNFANQIFEVPPGNSFYQDRLDLVDSLGVYVDVLAGVDITEQKAFWVFEAIDPATGLPPNDPDLGILPVNDSITRAGEGAVTYNILPKRTANTLDTLHAQASIIFDENESILTNIEFNTIDAVAPTSVMNPLEEVLDTTIFTLTWSGGDDQHGSGIKEYEVYLSEFDGPFYLHRSGIQDTFLRFEGYDGGEFCFLVKAVDLVGNQEVKTIGEACTRVNLDFQLDLTIALEGAFDATTGQMRDGYRATGKLPLSNPYEVWQYPQVNQNRTRTSIDSALLLRSDQTAIVDWTFIELRSATDSASVVSTRPGLLRKDGKVVGLDGRSTVSFGSVNADSVYVVVHHRNHLSVRSEAKYAVRKGVTSLNLASGYDTVFGAGAVTKVIGGLTCMIAGDANGDGTINAVDRNIYWRIQNGTPFNYLTSTADFNMDGVVNAIDQNLYWRLNNSRTTNVD